MDSAQLIASLISSLGIPGVLAWFLWYDTTTRQPETRRHYEAIVDKVLAQASESLKSQQEHYEKIIADVLAEHRDETAKLSAEIHGMVEHCKARV